MLPQRPGEDPGRSSMWERQHLPLPHPSTRTGHGDRSDAWGISREDQNRRAYEAQATPRESHEPQNPRPGSNAGPMEPFRRSQGVRPYEGTGPSTARWSPSPPSLPSFDRLPIPTSSRLPPLSNFAGLHPNSSSWENPMRAYERSPRLIPTTASSSSSSDLKYAQPQAPFPPSTSSRRSRSPSSTSISLISNFPKSPDPPISPLVDEDNDAPAQKKKRRMALSCAECAKRKQRCNRETPCQHCISRRVPELCVPYTRAASPPKSQKSRETEGSETGTSAPVPTRVPSQLPTLTVRVTRIEALLNAMVNRVDGLSGKALDEWRINHPPATSPPLRKGDISPKVAEIDLGSPKLTPDVEISPEQKGLALDELEPDSTITTTEAKDERVSPAAQFERSFRDAGLDSSQIPQLLGELPPKARADRLIGWFFKNFNPAHYPIDEEAFRTRYETLYERRIPNLVTVQVLPLLLVVLAIAIRLAPGMDDLNDEARQIQSQRYYWASKTARAITEAVALDVTLVETQILYALYLCLVIQPRLAEGWTEIRRGVATAQILNMHIDGTRLGLDPYQVEYRRRLWAYYLNADAACSFLLGRPMCIYPEFSKTKGPSNLDLKDCERPEAQSLPLTETTFATHLVIRCQLTAIIQKMARTLQRLDGPVAYSDVLELSSSLDDFISSLPPVFRLFDPDESKDTALWYLPIQRVQLHSSILDCHINLHRSWLLWRLHDDQFHPSRIACLRAALKAFRFRREYQERYPFAFGAHAEGFSEFNLALIAGIGRLVDLEPALSDGLDLVLRTFTTSHPYDPAKTGQSQREASIIHLFFVRAKAHGSSTRGEIAEFSPLARSIGASTDKDPETVDPLVSTSTVDSDFGLQLEFNAWFQATQSAGRKYPYHRLPSDFYDVSQAEISAAKLVTDEDTIRFRRIEDTARYWNGFIDRLRAVYAGSPGTSESPEGSS